MEHTKYISAKIKSEGLPQLSLDSFSRLMNVIHLEGGLEALRKARVSEKEEHLRYRYYTQEIDLREKLQMQTRNMLPADFIKSLMKRN